MRGNDQPVDVGVCGRILKRRPKLVTCEGALLEVRSARGGLIGYRCSRCSAQFDAHRQRIVSREAAE